MRRDMMTNKNAYTDNSFFSSDLKTILHSKHANIYYLSHCRVMQKDGLESIYEAQKKYTTLHTAQVAYESR